MNKKDSTKYGVYSAPGHPLYGGLPSLFYARGKPGLYRAHRTCDLRSRDNVSRRLARPGQPPLLAPTTGAHGTLFLTHHLQGDPVCHVSGLYSREKTDDEEEGIIRNLKHTRRRQQQHEKEDV